MSYTNFLESTKAVIAESGHTSDQISFIGSEKTGHECTWEEFCKLADFTYNPCHSIANDLIIVFADGQRMWRGDHDVGDWWNFSESFVRPTSSKKITRLAGPLWPNLADCNP